MVTEISEQLLQETIFPDLEKGRPNVDRPHTQAVVHHLKQIVENNPQLNLDLPVLLIAAYAHDWGYSGMFESGKPLLLSDVIASKEQHMLIGSEKVKALLQKPEFSFLAPTQKKRVIHLVEVHDKLDQLKDVDELILMEADTLGGLDTEIFKPSFDIESNDKYMKGVRQKRLPKFITEWSKQEFARLFKLREEYYQQGKFHPSH